MNNELTTTELTTLEFLEDAIQKSIASFIEIGQALTEIRNGRLYRDTHSTFEGYCKERWDIGKNYANKLIVSAKVVNNLGTVVPTTERQVRPLTKLEYPGQQKEAWEKACADAEKEDRLVVARDVTRAVKYVESKVIETTEVATEPGTPPKQRNSACKPRIGLQYANMAIVQLSKIPHNDVERKQAFARVITWIGEQT